ncbi:MAG: hypothetical protein IPJ82_17780 [Lewinellaceae bacterium]|nr:hypothetical protein [Lewinellaceae bacterium]
MIVRVFRYCFSVFFAVFTLAGAGAQTEAFAEADSNYAETGNPFTIRLKVVATETKPVKTDLSPWGAFLPKENILQQSDWLPNGPFYTQDLTVVFFDEDTLQLPPLNIELGTGSMATTNPLEITVIPTPSPDELVDMTGIKDIHREQASWMDYLPWMLAIAGLVFLVVLASWLIGRAQKKRGIASRTVELPPHELALKKLDVLEQKQLWQKGQIKSYCAEITYILREYLEKRYRIPALESTSEEILAFLKRTDFPDTYREGLQNMLTEADLAKFARAIPPEYFHGNAGRLAKELVQATRYIEPEPAQEQSSNHIKTK